jgi:hypothetical protein
VFYACFYDHARLTRLAKLLYLGLSRIISGEFFNHFWIQVAVSEVKRPLHGRFGSETAKSLTAMCLTDISCHFLVSVHDVLKTGY